MELFASIVYMCVCVRYILKSLSYCGVQFLSVKSTVLDAISSRPKMQLSRMTIPFASNEHFSSLSTPGQTDHHFFRPLPFCGTCFKKNQNFKITQFLYSALLQYSSQIHLVPSVLLAHYFPILNAPILHHTYTSATAIISTL